MLATNKALRPGSASKSTNISLEASPAERVITGNSKVNIMMV